MKNPPNAPIICNYLQIHYTSILKSSKIFQWKKFLTSHFIPALSRSAKFWIFSSCLIFKRSKIFYFCKTFVRFQVNENNTRNLLIMPLNTWIMRCKFPDVGKKTHFPAKSGNCFRKRLRKKVPRQNCYVKIIYGS